MKRKLVRFGFLAVLAFTGGVAFAADVNPPTLHSSGGAWPVRRQWTPAETQHYAQWVDNIFKMKTKGNVDQRTAKLARILTDPEMNLLEQYAFFGTGGNPQLPMNIISSVHSMLDCAKFTAFMPAYYAYRRALPWMYTYVYSTEKDVRQAPSNIPSNTVSNLGASSLYDFFVNGIIGYNSGNYRVDINGRNAGISDTVPVAINRQYLMPGCMNYTDGHCLLLGKITEYGELYFLNCSTATTRDIFTYNGLNTVSGITPRGSDDGNEWHCCYQGLRVFRYPLAVTNGRGEVVKVRRRTNEEMKEFGFSTEQYDVLQEMSTRHYITEGKLKPQGFHDFVRLRMKSVDKIVPYKYMIEYIDEILEVYRIREQFVQDAWRDVKRNGPIAYPAKRARENIFQAFGRWETWSSPSSDIDRRNKYFYLADWLEYAIRWFQLEPSFVDLAGLEKYKIRSQADMAKAFVEEQKRIFAEKSFTYMNSKGQPVKLTLADVEKRLYDMSFDPNHPPELRWGAPKGSAERATAPAHCYTPLPNGARVPMEEAYRLQYYYRTVCQRDTEESYLLNMVTEGFPVRDKFEGQLAKWSLFPEPVDGKVAPKEPVHILVPHDFTKQPPPQGATRAMGPARQKPPTAPAANPAVRRR